MEEYSRSKLAGEMVLWKLSAMEDPLRDHEQSKLELPFRSWMVSGLESC